MIYFIITIITATLLALILKKIKQPPIVAYLITGVLLATLKIKLDKNIVNIFSEIGIILLLFLAGLEFKLKQLKKTLKPSIIIGAIYFLLGSIIFYLIAGAFKHNHITKLYIAIALSLSSTILTVKMLTKRKEINSFHGQIIVGIMILQDIIAMTCLGILTNLNSKNMGVLSISLILIKALIIFLILLLFTNILKKIFIYASNEIELIFLIGLSWGFLGVAISHLFRFSQEIGAFLAGVAIANLEFSYEIKDKVRSIRDLGLIFFLISVGQTLNFKGVFDTELLVLIIIELIVTIIIISAIGYFLKLKKKQIFFIAMYPAQISEFSLILIAIGIKLGHINQEVFSKITLATILTLIISSAVLNNINTIFKRIKKYILTQKDKTAEELRKRKLKNHIIIFGFGKLGENIAKHFIKKNKIVVVDWNYERIEKAKKIGCETIYGDGGDPDIWEDINAKKAKLIINTIGNNQPDDINLIKWMKKRNKKTILISESNVPEDVAELKNIGYDFVLWQDEAEWLQLKRVLKKYGF